MTRPVEMRRDWAVTEIPVRASVGIARLDLRAKCSVCHRRRILYRIVVATMTGSDHTDARCAPCWGIRE